MGDLYSAAQKLRGFVAGDHVRFLRPAASYELGWPSAWKNDDVPVGAVGKVVRVDEGGVTVNLADYGERVFPCFVLDKMPKETA